MLNRFVFLFGIVFLSSCGCSKEEPAEEKKSGNIVGSAGDKIGQSVGNFAKGVKEGVEKVSGPQIQLSDALIASKITAGKAIINDTKEGKDNKLSIYLIFDSNAPLTTVIAKVYDNNDLEMGRTTIQVKPKAGDAGYYDFLFDARTNLDNDCRIVLDKK